MNNNNENNNNVNKNKRYKSPIRPLILALTTATLFIMVGATLAEDRVDVFFSYYKDDNELTVVTPSVGVQKDVGDHLTLGGKYTYETFSKDAPENAVDAVSGATTVVGGSGGAYSEVRHEGILNGVYRAGDNAWSLGLYGSTEDDFDSRGGSLAYSRELLQKNLTLTAMYGYIADKIYNENADPEDNFPKDKSSSTMTFAASQLLSPTSLITGGYSYSYIEGYQSQPSRKINVEQQIPGGSVAYTYDERHPNERNRHTYFLRFQKHFRTQTTLNTHVSLYHDDWGINSRSAEIYLYQTLTPMFIVRGRYRFYSQGDADFYQEAYTQEEDIMTADARLREFDYHLAGVKLLFSPKRFQYWTWSVYFAYDNYRETNNGINADIYKVGMKMPF